MREGATCVALLEAPAVGEHAGLAMTRHDGVAQYARQQGPAASADRGLRPE